MLLRFYLLYINKIYCYTWLEFDVISSCLPAPTPLCITYANLGAFILFYKKNTLIYVLNITFKIFIRHEREYFTYY